MTLADHVYRIVRKIPAGKVMTYSQIAHIVGTSPRVVGNFLHKNPDRSRIPCHRVVNSEGKAAVNFAFGGIGRQIKLLTEEGVIFKSDKIVDIEKYRFKWDLDQ